MSSYKRSTKLDNVVVVVGGVVRSENYKYGQKRKRGPTFLHFENICIILRASSILYYLPRKCTLSPSNFMLALPRDIYAYCY